MDTNYPNKINKILKPKADKRLPLVIDLFAGCGGLALGFEAQGFETLGYEMDKDCCETYNKNLTGKCIQQFLDVNSDFPKAEIVIGGPPCQPFSVRGKQKGLADERNGFPAFIAAVEKAKPRFWMFENVRGLFYKNKEYLNEVIETLKNLGYFVESHLVNASNYEVPQNRERVIVIGYKNGSFKFPQKLGTKVTAGEALGEMALSAPKGSRYLTPSMDTYVAKYEAASKCVVPRDLHMHLPARTLTCRNLSGSTSDMHRIKLPNGKRRQLLVREAARLQSFPDKFEFCGSESSAFKQIGNAVPPMLSYHIAGAVKEYLESVNKTPTKHIRNNSFAYQYQQAIKFNV